MNFPTACMTCGHQLSHLLPGYLATCDEVYAERGGVPYSTNILTSNMQEGFSPKPAKYLADNGIDDTRLCCKRHFLSYIKLSIPYGATTAQGLLMRNDDVIEELVTVTPID